MAYKGSVPTRTKIAFQLGMDWIERSAPRLDAFGLWAGGILTLIGAAIIWGHEHYPAVSFTETAISILSAWIRALHSWLPWSVADTTTYLGVPLFLLSLSLALVRRLNRIGSTTNHCNGE